MATVATVATVTTAASFTLGAIASRRGPGTSVPQRSTDDRATSPDLGHALVVEPPAVVELDRSIAHTDDPTMPAPEVNPAGSPARAGGGATLPEIASSGAPHAPRATLKTKAKGDARPPRGPFGDPSRSASSTRPPPQPPAPASQEGYKNDPYESE